MARYGSEGLRGRGVPEMMEKILQGQSRIDPQLMFLKHLSGAIAIGTRGPFGVEGPIIARQRIADFARGWGSRNDRGIRQPNFRNPSRN